MAALLYELLFDLKQRCSYLVAEMDRLKPGVAVEAASYHDAMAGLLHRGFRRIEAFLSDPAIQRPEYAKNYYYDYKRLAELMDDMEEGAVLALRRYGHDDRVVTKALHQLCGEIGYPYRPPLCSAISTQYYWALTRVDLIFVPCSEPFHLLGLPDLCHELAHFILLRQEAQLLRPFRRTVKR